MNQFMQEAVAEAKNGIKKRHGGPFGCVIVKDGKVIARGHNQVLRRHDATCHGEMMALRKASRVLKTFDLSGCDVYTTGEPCNMCLSACIWANINHIYYGCTIQDNSKIGFRDKDIDKIFGGREKLKNFLTQLDHNECLALFEEYDALNNKQLY